MVGAIYARFSIKEDNASFSLDSQVRDGLAYAAKNGITVPEEYIFAEEHTGTEFSRPLFDRVKRLCEQRQIDAVIVAKVSRIARYSDYAKVFWREYCQRNKVALHIVEIGKEITKNIADKVIYDVQSMFAEIDRDEILKRTQRGRLEKAQSGIALGQGVTLYGYGKTGTKKDTRLYIIEEESRVVHLIFDLFVNNDVSITEIVNILNVRGVPSPSEAHKRFWQSTRWNQNAVLRILRNKHYTGIFYAFRTQLSDNGKRVLKNETEQIQQHFPDLAIVDTDLFCAAQEIINNRRDRYTFVAKYEYLFAKRMWCACDHKCGVQTMTKNNKDHHYYRCAHKRRIGHSNSTCKIPYLNSNQIDSDAWNLIEAFIRNPKNVLDELQQAQQQQRQEHAEAVMTLEQLEKIRAEYEQRINRIYDDYEAELIPKSVYLKRKQPIDEWLAAAERVYNEQQMKVSQHVLSDGDIRQVLDGCRTISDLIDELGELTFQDKRRAVEDLDITGVLAIQNRNIVLTLYIHKWPFKQVILNDRLSCYKMKEYLPLYSSLQSPISLTLVVGHLK